MFGIPKIWAGTQEAFDFLLVAMESAYQIVEARAGAKDNPFELPPLLEARDGVGIVAVKGPLVAGSAGFMRLFGVTGYADIRDALVEAVADRSVKSIMLDVSSGGGAVEGADEASRFVSQVSAMKPVLTYASGGMASAAYWVGSAAQRRLASQTSVVGSIGTMATHIEYSKQLEKDGVGATIIRSGKWKALANSIEPLSAEGKAQLQSMVDDMNQIFESRVAANLGISAKAVHDRMGQGRVFLGARALDVGLIDGLASYQEAFLATKMLVRG
jgi:signal peptide peptidase SppA